MICVHQPPDLVKRLLTFELEPPTLELDRDDTLQRSFVSLDGFSTQILKS
jgi:hypothetical protein